MPFLNFHANSYISATVYHANPYITLGSPVRGLNQQWQIKISSNCGKI